jgi:hypothetical protein
MDSHRVHQRPSYPCRHGHNSARSTSSARPSILYIREDHLLARIRHDRQLHQQHPGLRNPDPHTVAAYLDTNNTIIVCDHDTCVIQTDTTTIALNAAPIFPFDTATVPAQRDGDQEEHENTSRLVWK